MVQVVRILLVVGGFGMAALAALFVFRQDVAETLWLWTDSRLSFYFLASMQAAIAAAMLWIGFSGELAALAAGALNLLVMMAGIAVSLLFVTVQVQDMTLLYYAVGCALFALFNGWLFVWARRIPLQDDRPLPGLLRISYILFIIVLGGVGIALFFIPNGVLPWPVRENNIFTPLIFGWMFLGDAFYFLYAVIQPRWHKACAQLCSFLAYDLVLLGPLLIRWPGIRERFPEVPLLPDVLIPNLRVYTVVLVYSALLGIFYLFIHPQTRLFGRAPAA
jgi:flagellar biosynthesis protein FliQ